jgi:23S rRNA (guanine745-N1)-methyltransferase
VLSDVVRLLACPVCRQPMSMDGAVVRCRQGHCFDVARQGHLNLTADRRPASPGDSAEMVAARARFLEVGHYSPFAEAVSAKAAPAATVLDLGAGTGWYLARVLDGPGPQPDAVGIALDISPYAARRAARCHPRVGAVVADTWGRLPVLDAVVDVVLVVFAPRHAAEVHRVLRPGGRFVVVTPLPEHLAELREPLGLLDVEPGKHDRLAASLDGRFELVEADEVRTRLTLARPRVADLVAMGPSARHRDPAGGQELVDAVPEPAEVTAAVRVAAYQRLD